MICLGVAAPLPTNTLVAELVQEKCSFAVVVSFCVWEKCTAGACGFQHRTSTCVWLVVAVGGISGQV